jgi:hypothetical protein
MSGGGIVLGASTTVPGAAGVAVLPDTGSFRVMFIVSAVALTIGVVTLAVTGFATFRRRHQA